MMRWFCAVAVAFALAACSEDSGAGAETTTASDAIAGADADAGAETTTGSQADADADAETTTDAGAETTTDAGAETTTDADADTRAEWPPPTRLGGDRPARIHVPDTYDGRAPIPAIVLLGGYDYLAQDLDDWLGVSAYVDARGFALVLADGRVDAAGSPYWNATDTCCDYDGTGVDDVGYLTALIDELEARLRVSGVYLWGHSAGAFMAYRMGCEIPARLEGIVSVAGSSWRNEADCAVRDQGLPILQVHGSLDDIMPFGGDSDAPGIREVLDRWARRGGCDTSAWTVDGSDLATADEGPTRVGHYRGTCDADSDVRLWRIVGADHYPTFTWDFIEDTLTWLLP